MKRKYISVMTYGGYRRDQVEADYTPDTLTAGEIIAMLSKYPAETPVYTWGDHGWGEIARYAIKFNS